MRFRTWGRYDKNDQTTHTADWWHFNSARFQCAKHTFHLFSSFITYHSRKRFLLLTPLEFNCIELLTHTHAKHQPYHKQMLVNVLSLWKNINGGGSVVTIVVQFRLNGFRQQQQQQRQQQHGKQNIPHEK